MLSGVKFFSRGKVSQVEHDSDLDSSTPQKTKRQHKSRRKYYSSSSDISEQTEYRKHRKRRSKKKAKLDSSSSSESDFSEEDKKHRKKRSKKQAKWDSSSSSESDLSEEKHRQRKHRYKNSSRQRKEKQEAILSEDKEKTGAMREDTELARKEMGLEWMVRPSERPDTHQQPQEPSPELQEEEEPKLNPKELNPHLKGGSSGHLEDDENAAQKLGKSQLPPPSIVGDGGASWRLKALKRAKEQAAREGRKLDEVVEERWGSLAQYTASVATTRAASAHSHLHAIRERKGEWRGVHASVNKGDNDKDLDSDDHMIRSNNRDYLRDVSPHISRMKAPKIHNSLSWRSQKNAHIVRPEDAELIRTAASSLNKYADDGNFFQKFNKPQTKEVDNSSVTVAFETDKVSAEDLSTKGEKTSSDYAYQQDGIENVPHKAEATSIDHAGIVHGLTANQLAAKAMQLRLKGKHAEADQLLKESQNVAKACNSTEENAVNRVDNGRSDLKKISAWAKQRAEDDGDSHLASLIMRNKQFRNDSRAADDEYDFDNIAGRKKEKNAVVTQQPGKKATVKIQKRILTQQERCNLCFDNPSRPKHLTISIANFTYLMLPPWEPVVPGHCYILPLQHEASTRNLDDNVWEEIRNFKKCLLRMFAAEEKDVLFLETVMGLVQQRRHCVVECIPVPSDIAKEAPNYFKKAIDEAEDEWSQHNAKKLIDTSVKGLRGSIPKNFPYFHVEFGLQKGFVHVIDDEKNFKSQFGLNVIRGMLQLREEDMYRRRQQETVEMQRKAASDFARRWEAVDWTKMLD
ncbi:hypothetical protein SUGI_0286780 [Cryptomeria japonica]|uniref:uncharacterized protein LOC131033028 n=1 Tax=Cryptomeria japonica TaxID=3369 RepID=UPI002408B258|nr:uncharacterized protein LOC131033028 [Cryptomeria japonica]XP_057820124.2 uncharacterized protein LOC131033028 [Cryptomeria japonica]XP_057820126.2 uncharacterized protein LOC131033028 [Cryptomeria japonica]GLJ16693.1 hypothetical protein SUGI_0286780 [Cryptomeria japonica]